MKFTVFGGQGFIGRHLVKHLRSIEHEVFAPSRVELRDLSADLGHVVYAIGLTGDFRSRFKETIEAHVDTLIETMANARFESWLYLSSTRLYGIENSRKPSDESSAITLHPSADKLYDVSKLMGETWCLAQPQETIRVARLSNVYGDGQSDATFLGDVLRSLNQTGSAEIGDAPSSTKDYVSINDVVDLLTKISIEGKARVYNVASGQNVSHQQLAHRLTELSGHPVSFIAGGHKRCLQPIDVRRIQEEFSVQSSSILDDMILSADQRVTFRK